MSFNSISRSDSYESVTSLNSVISSNNSDSLSAPESKPVGSLQDVSVQQTSSPIARFGNYLRGIEGNRSWRDFSKDLGAAKGYDKVRVFFGYKPEVEWKALATGSLLKLVSNPEQFKAWLLKLNRPDYHVECHRGKTKYFVGHEEVKINGEGRPDLSAFTDKRVVDLNGHLMNGEVLVNEYKRRLSESTEKNIVVESTKNQTDVIVGDVQIGEDQQ